MTNLTLLEANATGDNKTNTTACWNDYCMDEEAYFDSLADYIQPKHYEWVFVVVYLITFVVGLVGNALVCFAVCRNPNMRTVTNVFIVNLAVGDFLVILFCLPPTLLHDVTETWFLGSITCKAVLFLQPTSVSVSVLTLSAISVERWWAICYPLRFKSTLPRARKIIVVIWTVACLSALPELIVAETFPYGFPKPFKSIYLTVCRPSWDTTNQGIYHIIVTVVFYLIPMILMAFTYSHIATVLWKHEIPGDVVGTKTQGRKPMLDGNKNTQEDQILSRRKAARMLIAIVIMFAICYLPVHIQNVIRYFGVIDTKHSTEGDAHIVYALISHWLPYFNSAVNPVIYNFMSAKFRKEFKAACFCCFYGLRSRPFRARRDHTFTMTFSNSNYSNCHTEEVTMASI
ncbi:orexin receptor type 2 [Biomphalaria pfeifferi]|uniref:Orexin receptor type 2 n=1 Tax=Biomphalaria pfeifferi TaxID=112525 RepID=A0AAD8BE16_BIOPF|nr:orexin receptor type 2 [Biomphalaria pfeifferi]